MLRKLVLLVFVAALVSGCGNKEAIYTLAETEGTYVDVGGLTYQVQMSRYLNPSDPEDKQYLQGLAQGVSPEPPVGKIWFGVWMRVKNYSGETLRTATLSQFTITDTEDNEFTPTPLASTNPFIYEPLELQHSQVLPAPDTAQASGPIQGSLILFQLANEDLQNRPLVLHITKGEGDEAEVDLDL
jgi:hypothetical protein